MRGQAGPRQGQPRPAQARPGRAGWFHLLFITYINCIWFIFIRIPICILCVCLCTFICTIIYILVYFLVWILPIFKLPPALRAGYLRISSACPGLAENVWVYLELVPGIPGPKISQLIFKTYMEYKKNTNKIAAPQASILIFTWNTNNVHMKLRRRRRDISKST